MVIEAQIANLMGKKLNINEIIQIIRYYRLPHGLGQRISIKNMIKAIYMDKKTIKNTLRLYLPEKIGKTSSKYSQEVPESTVVTVLSRQKVFI